MNLAAMCLTTALVLPGGVTLHEFVGFETGGIEEVGAIEQYSIDTSPAPGNSREQYVCSLGVLIGGGGASYVRSERWSMSSQSCVTVGAHIYFTGIDADADMDFLEIGINLAEDIFLNVNTADGDLRVKDENGTVVATYSDAFVDSTWYLIELKYRKHATAGDAEVRIDEVRVITMAGNKDFLGGSGGAIDELLIRGPTTSPSNSAHVGVDVDNYYIYYDDGTFITTNATFLGDFTVIGPYNDTNQTGQTADFGDPWNSGSWDNTHDVPKNDSTVGEFTALGAFVEGGCTSNDGDNDGPSADSRVLGTIKGASWIARARKQTSSSQTWKLKYGAHTVAATDNTAKTGILALTTSYQAYKVMVDSSDANCPTKSEWFQFGAEQLETGFGKADFQLSEFWCFILHQEERRIILDGNVQYRER